MSDVSKIASLVFESPHDSENTATFAVSTNGGVVVSTFECYLELSRDEATKLRDWLNEILAASQK